MLLGTVPVPALRSLRVAISLLANTPLRLGHHKECLAAQRTPEFGSAKELVQAVHSNVIGSRALSLPFHGRGWGVKKSSGKSFRSCFPIDAMANLRADVRRAEVRGRTLLTMTAARGSIMGSRHSGCLASLCSKLLADPNPCELDASWKVG